MTPPNEQPPSLANLLLQLDQGSAHDAMSADLKALAALLAEQGSPIPSAGEREEPPTQAAGEPSTVDPEQASRLLATLTLTKETPHE